MLAPTLDEKQNSNTAAWTSIPEAPSLSHRLGFLVARLATDWDILFGSGTVFCLKHLLLVGRLAVQHMVKGGRLGEAVISQAWFVSVQGALA